MGYDTTGQYVIEFGEAVHLNDDATNKAIPRTYQIVRQIKEHCEKRDILPENVAVDATGAEHLSVMSCLESGPAGSCASASGARPVTRGSAPIASLWGQNYM